MSTEFADLSVPPHICAIFEEWAKDWDAVPAWAAQLQIDAGGTPPAELAVFYRLLAKPVPHKLVSYDCLVSLLAVAMSNQVTAPTATSLGSEAGELRKWLEAALRQHFPDRVKPA